MLIDTLNLNKENAPKSNPTVCFGSTNWSKNAKDNNDENMLCIESKFITNQFEQNFQEIFNSITTKITKDDTPPCSYDYITEEMIDISGQECGEELLAKKRFKKGKSKGSITKLLECDENSQNCPRI